MKRTFFLGLFVTGCLSTVLGQQAPSDSGHNSQFQAVLHDYDQTIGLFETGVRQRWNQDRLRTAFVSVYGPSISSGTHLTACGYPVLILLTAHTVWDERTPFATELGRTLAQCQNQRAFFEGYIRSRHSN